MAMVGTAMIEQKEDRDFASWEPAAIRKATVFVRTALANYTFLSIMVRRIANQETCLLIIYYGVLPILAIFSLI